MLLMEHHSGESEMSDDEYEQHLWPADRLRPATGGHVFVVRAVRNGYKRCVLGGAIVCCEVRSLVF